MNKVKGHSLWIMPEGETAAELARLIECLAAIYGSPVFKPHITLLGQVVGSKDEVASKTAELAASIAPYEISLNKVESLDSYYQCLFIRCKECDAVMDANKKARKIFGREKDPAYMPHLSLMYGDFSPEKKKEVISNTGNLIKRDFMADSIHLFSTDGTTEQWKSVGEFRLRGR